MTETGDDAVDDDDWKNTLGIKHAPASGTGSSLPHASGKRALSLATAHILARNFTTLAQPDRVKESVPTLNEDNDDDWDEDGDDDDDPAAVAADGYDELSMMTMMKGRWGDDDSETLAGHTPAILQLLTGMRAD
eukprot:2169081-Karenia_brevis.AAC.1